MVDESSGKPRGFGFVSFEESETAEKVFYAIYYSSIRNQVLVTKCFIE